MAAKREGTKKTAARDGGTSQAARTVEEVIAGYPAKVQELAERLRRLVKETVPQAGETVKWGNPVFEVHGKGLCYLQGHKEYLRFGFFEQAQELDDPDGLLEGTGKAMRHVKVRSEADVRPIFEDWLQRIAEMNEERAGGRAGA